MSGLCVTIREGEHVMAYRDGQPYGRVTLVRAHDDRATICIDLPREVVLVRSSCQDPLLDVAAGQGASCDACGLEFDPGDPVKTDGIRLFCSIPCFKESS